MKNIKLFGKKIPILAVMVVLMIASASAAVVYFGFEGEVTVQSPFGETMVTPIMYDATLYAGDDVQAGVMIPNDANNPILAELSTSVTPSDAGVSITYVDADGIVLPDVDGDGMQELILMPGINGVGISAHTTPEVMNESLIDVELVVTTEVMSPEDVDYVGLMSKDANNEYAPTFAMTGYVVYATSGDEFNFAVKATGLDTAVEAYDLLYYADYEDRFNTWGDAPGSMVIATITTGAYYGVGVDGLFMNSAEDTGDLPATGDANEDAVNHDYRGAPDFYATATGAKLWLVPTGEDVNPDWNPSEYLFEMGLVQYTETAP